jgi:hypothetical protein
MKYRVIALPSPLPPPVTTIVLPSSAPSRNIFAEKSIAVFSEDNKKKSRCEPAFPATKIYNFGRYRRRCIGLHSISSRGQI